jgi:hypothetical protein
VRIGEGYDRVMTSARLGWRSVGFRSHTRAATDVPGGDERPAVHARHFSLYCVINDILPRLPLLFTSLHEPWTLACQERSLCHCSTLTQEESRPLVADRCIGVSHFRWPCSALDQKQSDESIHQRKKTPGSECRRSSEYESVRCLNTNLSKHTDALLFVLTTLLPS